MTGFWFTNFLNTFGPVVLGAWCIWGIVSVLLHELAHGWTAVRRGDPTPIDSGHMTWNPLVHMGAMGVIMFVLVGLPSGAMPVDPSRMRGKYGFVMVALAGPVMNLSLAIACIVVGGVIGAFVTAADLERIQAMEISSTASPQLRMAVFCFVGAWINIALALFNLIPVPPLDGSTILAGVSERYGRFVQSDAGRFISMFLFVLAFFFVGRVLYPMAFLASALGIGLIAGALKLVGVGP
ncbi:MAG: site-2 protease family protein [Phycisphaerales bacterium]|nr:site-2 protease family protein [Phycisphaerales bacterium]